MRTCPSSHRVRDLRRRVERLEGLPLRPATVRQLLADVLEKPGPIPQVPLPRIVENDPGWVLALLVEPRGKDPLELIDERPWWPLSSPEGLAAVDRLWRHGVAVACAARRLAQEAGLAVVEHVGRVGLLHQLGLWALAAVDADLLASILEVPGPHARREAEIATLGTDAATLGRSLAERWGCDAELVDAAWLHADQDGSLDVCAYHPEPLHLIQQARAWADRTPWSLSTEKNEAPTPGDPRLRLLVAEVQVRCGSGLVDRDVSAREESLSRAHARLIRRMLRMEHEASKDQRLIEALSGAKPSDGPESWAERAAMAWCATSGVAAARVIWTSNASTKEEAPKTPSRSAGRPAPHVLPLRAAGQTLAEIHLWPDDSESQRPTDLRGAATLSAWEAWAALVADRDRLARRLEMVVAAHQRSLEQHANRRQADRLDGLAQFAAGAGHELNNPLAVILGRAQLLLARTNDPESARSLRAIIAQTQRAHRILRDLMYVARPPTPRPRLCQPEEIARTCLRDLQAEAEARGVRTLLEVRENVPSAWADPETLRHLADVLLRNALEATPAGGEVHLSLGGTPRHLVWEILDGGKGITEADASRLFDPFFCGRQAGRGLGLGLPRAAQFLAQIGGRIRWRSSPGHGSLFTVHIPLESAPEPAHIQVPHREERHTG